MMDYLTGQVWERVMGETEIDWCLAGKNWFAVPLKTVGPGCNDPVILDGPFIRKEAFMTLLPLSRKVSGRFAEWFVATKVLFPRDGIYYQVGPWLCVPRHEIEGTIGVPYIDIWKHDCFGLLIGSRPGINLGRRTAEPN